MYHAEGVISSIAADLWARAYYELGKRVGKEFSAIGITRNEIVTAYVSQQGIEVCGRYSENFFDKRFRQRLLAESLDKRKLFQQLVVKVNSLNLSELDNPELAILLDEYSRCFTDVAGHFTLSQEELTQPVYEYVRAQLIGLGATDDEIFTLLLPATLDAVKLEEVALLKLALSSFNDTALKDHIFEHAFMSYGGYNEEENVASLKKQLDELSRLGKPELSRRISAIDDKLSKTREEQQKLSRKYSGANALELALFLRDMGLDRFELKKQWAGAEYQCQPLFCEAAKRVGLTVKELFSRVSMRSLIQALSSDSKTVLKLEPFSAFYINDGDLQQLQGKPAEELARRLVPQFFEEKRVRELRGVTASPGTAKARARIVKMENASDWRSFEKGDILVTQMTQPNMTLIMRKAAAVITDEGGITSHAAVLSREFGIPCVVGTHTATRAIKDGDLIEVIAEPSEGVVRILGTTPKAASTP